jgi:mannose-6-phosphate isomerase-like protein (cupin superfamily)
LLKAVGLSVIEERMPPGRSEVRHSHNAARQFFYVLAGTATMELDGEELTLRPREGVEVAPRVPHRMMNRAAEDLEFLVVSAPPSHGDRVVA